MKTTSKNDSPVCLNENGEAYFPTESEKSLALRGTLRLTSSDGQTTGKWFAFKVSQDAVIATAYIKSANNPSATQVQVSNLTSAALYQGDYYSAGLWADGSAAYFSQITLTSGSILLYLV